MFYPKCPKCGSDHATSAQSDSVSEAGRRAGMWLRMQQMAGHPHPLVKAAYLSALVGNAIYRRYPGGGPKRCNDCGHLFR
jgi:hypothetical protein